MFLACDIGNSNIKAGIFSDDNIIETFLFNNIDELKALYSEKEISFTGVSSVIPQKSALLTEFLNSKGLSFYQVTTRSNPGFTISYKTPETLGVDRICSAAGAWYMNGEMKENEAIISLDFGTATTVNIILYPGNFVGGIIAPGIPLMSRSLHSSTAQLPEINIDDYHNIIGLTTKESIASGLVNYTLGMIDRIINHLKNEYTTEIIKIFITGGNAEKIIPFLNVNFVYEKNLVLMGIKRIVNLNSSEN